MTIEDVVIAIAARMPENPSVLWGSIYEQNIIVDDIEATGTFPVILMYPPIAEGTIMNYGKVLNEYAVTLSFISKVDVLEEQNTNAKAVILAMRELAFSFVNNTIEYLNALGTQPQTVEKYLLHSLDPTKKLDTNMFFDQYDLNVAGYGLTIKIPLLQKISTCT